VDIQPLPASWRDNKFFILNRMFSFSYNVPVGFYTKQGAIHILQGGRLMSRRVIMLSVAVLFGMQAGLAMAANPDTGPGCGLGKLAWGDYKHQKNIGPQVLMATTNGTFGSQTFGISTGTSGCTNDGKVMAEQKTTLFAQLNFENLSQEMAQGQGEHLASLATLMGVPAEQQHAFFAMTQERYTSLVKTGEASPVAMVKAINDAIASHPVLAQVSTR
jgi:hypothetical protein